MQFIITSLFLLTFSVYSLAISVGFKTNLNGNSVLIIGEMSNVSSSVQISNILHQLKVFKNLYTKLHNEIMIPVAIGKKMKVSRKLRSSEASLYDVQSPDFINFLRSKINVSIGKNYGIPTYLTIYANPSLLVRTTDVIAESVEVALDDPILVDIKEIFTESMEVTYNSRPSSPIVEYDDIYGGNSITSGLLRERQSTKPVKCCEKLCTIM